MPRVERHFLACVEQGNLAAIVQVALLVASHRWASFRRSIDSSLDARVQGGIN